VSGFFQDLRYALRSLGKSPGFTVMAVLTLALGIGANTAIFSVVQGVLLKPLPYRDAERLQLVQTVQKESRQAWATAPPDFYELRSRSRVFEDLASFYVRPSNLTGKPEPLRVPAMIVSSNFFDVFGLAPSLGRGFSMEDERWGSHRVVVLTDGLWRRRFGGDPAILGQVISLNALPHLVVGVLKPKTSFLGINAELFVPMAFEPGDNLNTHNNYFLTMVGRVKSGTARAQALADVNAIMDEIKRRYPENRGLAVDVTPLRDALVGGARPAVLVLMGAVAFVLLIACGNVANLLLARALGRRREIAIRAALGAGRRRLLQQFLTEGVLLAALGGAVGLILASWGIEALHKVSTQVLPRVDEVRLDPLVMAFTLGLSIVTGLLFGSAPAFHATGLHLQDALKEGIRATDGAGGRGGVRGALVVTEIALSLVLLIGAGLMIKSVHRLLRVDAGFDPRGVLTAEIALPPQKYVDPELERQFSPGAYAKATGFFDSVIGRVRALPGVRAAGAVSGLPLAGENWGKSVTFYDRPLPSNVRDLPPIQYRVVAGDYFRALGIRLLRGRAFADTDTLHSPPVAIVNGELVRRYWKGEDPIGKTLSVNPPRELVPAGTLPPAYPGPQKFTVVGVADDVRYGRLDRKPPPLVYVPHAQGAEGTTTLFLVVAAGRDPLGLAAAVREQVWQVDRDQPVANISTMESSAGNAVARPRLEATLLGAFAALAVLLAAVGIYGVISYSVSQATREIGIRIALGAMRRDVMAMVLKQSLRLAVLGLAIGVLISLALTRVLRTLLFGVSATDPVVFGAIAALVAAVALLASLVPARQAAHLDPMTALRRD
jgi:putative ABC transport system permease protein